MACMELTLARVGVVESQQRPTSLGEVGEKKLGPEGDDAVGDQAAAGQKRQESPSVGRQLDLDDMQEGFRLGRIDGSKLRGVLACGVLCVRTRREMSCAPGIFRAGAQ